MPTISLAMIVRNDEQTLPCCLDSVKAFADEIIIADIGSSDGTKQVAAAYTPHVFDYGWRSHFGEARNFSFSKATMDYIFWINACEYIQRDSLKKLYTLKHFLPPCTDVVYTGHLPRLVKRDNHFLWFEPAHEFLRVWGEKLYTDIVISPGKPADFGYESDLRIYENAIQNHDSFSPRAAYFYSRALKAHGRESEALYYNELFLDAPLHAGTI